MTLTLTILRCPDAVPPETRQLSGGEFRIGRGPENDWIMPDPERLLSKRHCVIAFRNGGWAIADISTNGTYLNRDPDPIGNGQIRELRDGDRIRFGAYEIEARIGEAAGVAASGFGKGGSPFDDPFGGDVFAPAPAPGPSASSFTSAAFGPDDPLFAGLPGQPAVMLPEAFDPLSAPERDFLGAPAQADHSPAFTDAFRPPASRQLLPDDDDWDLSPLPTQPLPTQPPLTQSPPTQPFARNPASSPGGSLPWGAPAPESPFGEAAPFTRPAPLPPRPPEAGTPFGEAADSATAPPIAPPVIAPSAPAAASAPTPAAARDEARTGALLAAFLKGAGLEGGATPADPEALMHAVGGTFRALVSGIRQALIARAAIKGEFRIEQTMIRARGNNPLKFSADDNDALAALLGLGRRVDMGPDAAVSDALRDMRLHELATMAAMQDTMRALLARLDPAKLPAEGGMTLLPAQRKARSFEAYEKLHETMTRALADDFDSVFGKSFARAYETALREISARET